MNKYMPKRHIFLLIMGEGCIVGQFNAVPGI